MRKSIINLNTLFLLILAFIFYNIKIDYHKTFGVILLLIGTIFYLLKLFSKFIINVKKTYRL